jgi:hypothetical protein
MALMVQMSLPDPVVVQVPQPPAIPMDPNLLVDQVVPLVAVIAAVVGFVLIARWFFHSPIGEAVAEGIRLRRRRRYGLPGDGGADEPRVAALEEQVRLLSTQVAELGERLDFTERMLATQRERRIGAGS